MGEYNEHRKSFLKRWSDGDLASQPVVGTVVLAVILILTLLVAQIFVWVSARRLRIEQQSIQLIRSVSEQGLDTYLGNAPLARYYLLKEQDELIGYAATIIEPQILPNGELIFKGREFQTHLNTEKTFEKILFYFITEVLQN